jgi:hypothetical protein
MLRNPGPELKDPVEKWQANQATQNDEPTKGEENDEMSRQDIRLKLHGRRPQKQHGNKAEQTVSHNTVSSQKPPPLLSGEKVNLKHVPTQTGGKEEVEVHADKIES